MGTSASVQSAVIDINNNLITELRQSANSTATTNCSIKIENINIGEVVNCNISFKNECSSESAASLDASISAIQKSINAMAIEQKAEAAKYFTTTYGIQSNVQNISANVKTYIEAVCSSNALLNNEIKIGQLFIGKCISTGSPISMDFINTGQAAANCAIKTVLDTALTATNTISLSQSVGTDLSKYLWPIIIGVSIIFITIAVLYYLSIIRLNAKDKIDIELAKKNTYDARIISLKRNAEK